MKKLLVGFLACLLTAFSSVVLAQDSHQDKENYLGVTLGLVYPKDLDSDERFPDRVSLSDVKPQHGFILGVKVGRAPERFARLGPPALAVELEGFMISGTDVENEYYYFHPYGSPVDLRADISITALMFNVLLRDPYGQFHPYGGVGMGWAWFAMENVRLAMLPGWQWPDTSTNISKQGDLDDNTFAFQILLGANIDLTQSLSADLGYRFLRAEPEIEFTKGGADLDTKMTYQTHMLTVGLTYKF
jgi:opacity protein-like surface antigen